MITWVIVTWVVKMDPKWSAATILLAALPSAASCFVIARQHGMLVAETSGTIWLSTVLSAGTVLVVLSLMHLGLTEIEYSTNRTKRFSLLLP